MPIMLGSDNCWLNGKNHKELALLQECPYDPRGYFIIKGTEKVMLIQEQMTRNRILIEPDSKTHTIIASCASVTLETKTRLVVFVPKYNFWLFYRGFWQT